MLMRILGAAGAAMLLILATFVESSGALGPALSGQAGLTNPLRAVLLALFLTCSGAMAIAALWPSRPPHRRAPRAAAEPVAPTAPAASASLSAAAGPGPTSSHGWRPTSASLSDRMVASVAAAEAAPRMASA
jgi:hypothetical protein